MQINLKLEQSSVLYGKGNGNHSYTETPLPWLSCCEAGGKVCSRATGGRATRKLCRAWARRRRLRTLLGICSEDAAKANALCTVHGASLRSGGHAQGPRGCHTLRTRPPAGRRAHSKPDLWGPCRTINTLK